MTRRQSTAQFVAALAALALSGCGTIGLFGEYDIPESPEVANAPWPRLVDIPEAPPPGTYTAAVPDPAKGAAAVSELGTAAAAAGVLAVDAARPVVEEGVRAATLARARDRAAGLSDPVIGERAAGLADVVERAQARAAALSAPVISDAEREKMLARARQEPPPTEE